MQPGDKVRFLHSKGEGIIRKVIDSKSLEVEIEDGFIIPVLKSELVKISGEERGIMKEKEYREDWNNQGHSSHLPYSNEKIYLSLIPFNDKIYSFHLINQTNKNLLFSFFTHDGEEAKGVASGIVEQGKILKLTEEDLSRFEKWPEYIFQFSFFSYGITSIIDPYTKRIKFKAASFSKKKQMVPLLNKEGYLISLEKEENVKIPERLSEKMFERKGEDPLISIEKSLHEIDLHIEKLAKDFSTMSNAEILDLQISTFEKKLDNAIANGMEEIIFIHGVGNGILKNKIHKLLSQNKNIRFFKDARKEKFGYGATLVKIK
jgi:hypothetical protein